MADYATIEQVRADLPAATDADVPALERRITSASRAIDAYTGRGVDAFAAATDEETTRTFYGNGKQFLTVGYFVKDSIVSISAPTGYAIPYFVQMTDPTGAYNAIRRTLDGTNVYSNYEQFYPGIPYHITARWGLDETPADITEACIQLVARWYRNRDGNTQGIAFNEIRETGRGLDGMPQSVKELLAPYVVENEDTGALAQVGSLYSSEFN